MQRHQNAYLSATSIDPVPWILCYRMKMLIDSKNKINKIKMFYPPRSSCWSITPLRFRFVFWRLGNFDELRHEKLPFDERDRNIGEEDEPRHWVQAVVEDMRHFVQILRQKQTWKNKS